MSLSSLSIKKIDDKTFEVTRADGVLICPVCGHSKFRSKGSGSVACRNCGHLRTKNAGTLVTESLNGILFDTINSLWKERQ